MHTHAKQRHQNQFCSPPVPPLCPQRSCTLMPTRPSEHGHVWSCEKKVYTQLGTLVKLGLSSFAVAKKSTLGQAASHIQAGMIQCTSIMKNETAFHNGHNTVASAPIIPLVLATAPVSCPTAHISQQRSIVKPRLPIHHPSRAKLHGRQNSGQIKRARRGKFELALTIHPSSPRLSRLTLEWLS